jgi:hypothetical protein
MNVNCFNVEPVFVHLLIKVMVNISKHSVNYLTVDSTVSYFPMEEIQTKKHAASNRTVSKPDLQNIVGLLRKRTLFKTYAMQLQFQCEMCDEVTASQSLGDKV